MKKLLQTIDKWHQTQAGLTLFVVIEMVLAYLFGSLAIHSGSLFDYAITFLLVLAIAQNLVGLVRLSIKEKEQKERTHKERKDG